MVKDILRNIIGVTGYEFRKIKNSYDEELYGKLYVKESIENRRFYNISAGGHIDFGCGIHHPLWTNIDVDRPWVGRINYNPVKDIAYDPLTLKPLPVASDSAEIVYSRVTVEHMPNDAAHYLLSEIRRILKMNGVFRVVTPNIDLDYRAFVQGDRNYFYWAQDYSLEQAFLAHFAHGASPRSSEHAHEKISDEKFRSLFETMNYEDALDYCISKCDVATQVKNRGSHINWWNPGKVEKMLRAVGFTTIYESAAEQSACPVLRNEYYFDNVFQKAMLYMEAVKT